MAFNICSLRNVAQLLTSLDIINKASYLDTPGEFGSVKAIVCGMGSGHLYFQQAS